MLLIDSNENYEKGVEMVKEARRKIASLLKSKPSIHTTGIGYKRDENGEPTNELSLIIFADPNLSDEPVSRDFPGDMGIPEYITLDAGPTARGGLGNRVGTQIKTMPAPVLEGESIYPQRVRPVKGGYSISPFTSQNEAFHFGSSGTAGGCAWDNVFKEVVLLTNNHIAGKKIGTQILQPSTSNGPNNLSNYIGRVVRISKKLDAAVIKLDNPQSVAHVIEGVGPAIFAIADAKAEQIVEKVGQKSGKTRGKVFAVEVETRATNVNLWAEGSRTYSNDILIESLEPDGKPFTSGGDSGSLYVLVPEAGQVSKTPVVVGLHWGSVGAYSCGHIIKDVFQDLKLAVACTGGIRNLINSRSDDGSGTRDFPDLDELGNPIGEVEENPFSRDLEEQILAGDKGKAWLDAVSENRAAIVELLNSNEGGQSLIEAFGNLIAPGASVDQVMNTPLTEQNIAAFMQMVANAQNLNPDLGNLIEATNAIFAGGEGKTLAELIQ